MPLDQPRAVIDSPRMGTLTDVPEDQPLTPSARSPYFHHAVTGSATTFKPAASTTSLSSSGPGGSTPARTPSSASQRTPSGLTARSGQPRSASGDASSGMATPRNQRSSSPATVKEKDGDKDGGDKDEKRERRERGSERAERKGGKNQPPLTYRPRNTPHLPHAKDVELAPATLMHWSRAPVYGMMPLHGMRAHSVTLIDSIAWLFGGCDEKGCWKDVFCFNSGELFVLSECGHLCSRRGRNMPRMTGRVEIHGAWHDGHSPGLGGFPVRLTHYVRTCSNRPSRGYGSPHSVPARASFSLCMRHRNYAVDPP